MREGELKFTTGTESGATPPTASFGSFSVAGKNAVLTFDSAKYDEKQGALSHVGGVDGNGTLNIVNGSHYAGDAELFTIGVQGRSVGDGSEGSNYNGTKENGFGKGVVNVVNSTAELTYRHLQMGEGTLNVDNSTVTVGNKTALSEFYKGYNAIMGVGEGTTSTINVTNGGILDICASTYFISEKERAYGGFSTNYSDDSTANIIVDGGTLSVTDPENADPERYPEGRNGTVYIGNSFKSDSKNYYTKNATANIEIKNGGVASFDVFAVKVGYKGMADNGSSVNITVGEADNKSTGTLNLRAKDIIMSDGVTLNNYGTVSADTTYMEDTENNDDETTNSTWIRGAKINNYNGASFKLTNGLEVESNSVVNNEGTITASNVTVTGTSFVDNKGTISGSEITVKWNGSLDNKGTIKSGDWLNIEGNAQVTNSGTIDARVWLTSNGTLTLEDAAKVNGTLYIGKLSTLIVDGQVSLNGKLDAANYATDAEIIFTLGSSIDMNGKALVLNSDTVSLIVQLDGTVTDDTAITMSGLFTNYDMEKSNINKDTVVYLRGSDNSEVATTLGAITVPEPTTATLSLLALAALAARRRRAAH